MELEILTLAQIRHLARFPLVWIITIARITAALYIFIDPLWGLVASIVFDILDGQVLLYKVHISMKEYEAYDKPLDWVTHIVELWVGARYGFFLPLFLLLFYRFMGQFMYMRTGKRYFFVVFPNFFEFSFLWLIVTSPAGTLFDWHAPHPWEYLFLLLIFKQGQEFFMHHWWDNTFKNRWNAFIGNRVPFLRST